MDEKAARLNVGDVVSIPEISPADRFLIVNTEPPASATRITVDDDGRERIHLPGTLPEGLRTFIRIGHWTVERTLAVQAHDGPVSAHMETIIRDSYELPPYEVPQE